MKAKNELKSVLERPRVGIGVMILKRNQVLLGKRKGSHGVGEWSFPGGHLEYGESMRKGALREVKEECGLKIRNLNFQSVLNVKKYNRHYVIVGFLAHWQSGEPKLLEPDRFEEWRWFGLNRLPRPIFEGSKLMIRCYKTGQNYFDA